MYRINSLNRSKYFKPLLTLERSNKWFNEFIFNDYIDV